MNHVYAHLPQDENIGFEERSYSVTEGLLEYQGQRVLYLHVEASAVTFCDGRYATYLGSISVKGYVCRWKYEMNERGEALSEIEPIMDEEEQRAIRDLLRASQYMSTVNFL